MLYLVLLCYTLIKTLFGAIVLIKIYNKNTYYHSTSVAYFNGKDFCPTPNKKFSKHHIGTFRMLIYWWFSRSHLKSWKNIAEVTQVIPSIKLKNNEIKIYYINHSTFLIQSKDYCIITDPIYSKKAGPWFLGTKRHHPPAIAFDDLPKIDYILLSHNHYDHMDIPTIKKLNNRDNPTIITFAGNDYTIRNNISNTKVIALLYDDILKLSDNLFIYADRAYHWSKRTFFDTNKALWGSFIIKLNNKKIFFAGDTAWKENGKIFKDIGKKHSQFDLSMLPIGSYKPRVLLKDAHVNPYEAVLIHSAINSKKSISMHHYTFCLSKETLEQPRIDLEKAKQELCIPNKDFELFFPGSVINLY